MEHTEHDTSNKVQPTSDTPPIEVVRFSPSGNTITLKCSACGTEMDISSKNLWQQKIGDISIYKVMNEIQCTGCGTKALKGSYIFKYTKPAKTSKVPFGTIIIAIFLIIGLFGILSPVLQSNSSEERSVEAWVCAQNAVSESLRAPSTADFPSYSSDYVTHIAGDEYRISAYVDAQNALGTVVRQYFTVTLTLTEEGYMNASVKFS